MIELSYKNILFRADSSSSIGTGHIMRDLVLAEEFKGNTIIFATLDLPNNINNKILESGYKVEILSSNDVYEVIELVKKYNINLLVIDHYEIDATYETLIKNHTNTKILAFDDLYNKHNCDILLNHNICADESKYKTLVPKNCELRCGQKYTLLRDEFIEEKKNQKFNIQHSTFNILIAMGGADSANLNIKIIEVLNQFENLFIDVITTNGNKNLEELERYCLNKNNITLHINTNQMAKLINNSSFAIITPSVTANEVLFMNVPFIAIKTASNQEEMYTYLINHNIKALETFDEKILYQEIKNILKESVRE